MNKQSQARNDASMWNQAIQHVEGKLGQLNGNGNEAKRLRAAVGSFKAHRDAGFEWPGIRTAGTAVDSAPAKG